MADPAAPAGPSTADALERLRRRFVAGLPQRWREIAGAADTASRQAALHRLAGAAGSYGLEAVGQRARAAEQALIRDDAAAARQALEDLARELAAAGVTVP